MRRWLIRRIIKASGLHSGYRIPWNWKLGASLYGKESFKKLTGKKPSNLFCGKRTRIRSFIVTILKDTTSKALKPLKTLVIFSPIPNSWKAILKTSSVKSPTFTLKLPAVRENQRESDSHMKTFFF